MTDNNADIEQNNKAEHAIENSLIKAAELDHLGSLIFIDRENAKTKAMQADDSLNEDKSALPLYGVPIVVKDNIHVAGMPNSAGTLALKDFIPQQSDASVLALEAAGAIVIAKANMHELAFGITSNNVAFGAVKNAHDHDMIAGGSSGGTAVAIAAGIVSMGLGTDTGGSTRIPATLNGIVGFRPTLGRYKNDHVTPVATTRDTVGPMADSVSSVALLDGVISGDTDPITPAELKSIRLGVVRDYFYRGLSSEVEANIESVLTTLEQAGVELVEIEVPELEGLNNQVSFPVALHEFMTQLPGYLQKYDTGIDMNELVSKLSSPDVIGTVASQQSSEKIPEEVYQDAINLYRPQLIEVYSKAFSTHQLDALIAPATPCAARPIVTSDETIELNGNQVPTFPTYIQNVDPVSNAGLPSLALPSGKTEQGLPIGILLDGPENSDRHLLSIGAAIEALLKTGN